MSGIEQILVAAAEKMRSFATGDFESDHWDADELLVQTLLALHGEAARPLVDAYAEIGKWYA